MGMTRAMKRRNRRKARSKYLGGHHMEGVVPRALMEAIPLNTDTLSFSADYTGDITLTDPFVEATRTLVDNAIRGVSLRLDAAMYNTSGGVLTQEMQHL